MNIDYKVTWTLNGRTKLTTQNPELNSCYLEMHVKFRLTGFLSGQRRTDFTDLYHLLNCPACTKPGILLQMTASELC
jgi:hypothetical protein